MGLFLKELWEPLKTQLSLADSRRESRRNLKHEGVWCAVAGLKMEGWQGGWVVFSWERPPIGSQQDNVRLRSTTAGWILSTTWTGREAAFSPKLPDEYLTHRWRLDFSPWHPDQRTQSHRIGLLTHRIVRVLFEAAVCSNFYTTTENEHRNWPLKNGLEWNPFGYRMVWLR